MNKIKNILKSKVTMAILACLLLVGVFAGISALATEQTPTLTITGTNINHRESASIVYEVTFENLTSAINSKSDLSMKFWYDEAPASLDEEPDFVTPSTSIELGVYSNGKQTVEFESEGVAPKQMTRVVYAAAFYGEQHSEIKRYSVFEYLCDVNAREGNTEQQTALYAAMEQYITYAQKYLNWDKDTTPDQIGYFKVSHGHFTIADANGVFDDSVKCTSAALKVGTKVKIDFDYSGSVYRVDTGSIVKTDVNTYTCSVTADDMDRHYSVAPNVTINEVANADLMQIQALKVNGDLRLMGGKPVLTAIKQFGFGSAAPIFELDTVNWSTAFTALVAKPTNASGEYFSHWTLGDEILCTDEVLPISLDLLESVDNFAPVAVYDSTPGRLFNDFNANTRGGSGADVVYDIDNDENIYSLDKSAAGTQTSGFFINAKSSSIGTNKVEKMVSSFTFNMAKHADHDTTASGSNRKALYSSNGVVFSAELRLNGSDTNARTTFVNFDGVLVNAGHIQLKFYGDNGNIQFNQIYDNTTLITGQDNVISFSIYTEHGADGVIRLSHMNMYINGHFFASGCISTSSSSYVYTGNTCQLAILPPSGFKGKLTISNISHAEFFKD